MSDYTVPVKMNLHHLCVEITRQCNLNCAHCARGDVQDVTITPEIIDKLLDQINFIWKLDLTGGEVFLHPEMVEYLFDGIIKRGIPVFVVGNVTNGTICNQRAADCFSKMAEYVNGLVENMRKKNPSSFQDLKDTVGIGISTDLWHQQSPLYFPEATYKFYKEHCSPDVHVAYQDEVEIHETKYIQKSLHYAGRAKNFNLDELEAPLDVDSPFHRFAMGDKNAGAFCPEGKNNLIEKITSRFEPPVKVLCQLEISAIGGIYNGGLQSYDEVDVMAEDNILTCSLYDAIWNWNHRYPLLCKEAKEYYKEPKILLVNHADTNQKPIFDDIRRANNDSSESIESIAQKYLLAVEDLVWVRQQIQNRYKDRFLPFSVLFDATKDTFSDALELPAHDLDNRWKLLRKASKELKELLIVHKIDPDCPDLKCDDTDYDNTTDEDGLGDLAMMELLEKY